MAPPVTGSDRESLLRTEHLSVEYSSKEGPVRALDDVSFAIGPGEILGVIGESGSGKSTLGRAILGLLPRQARVTGGSIQLTLNEPALDVVTAGRETLNAARGRALALVPQATGGALNPVIRIDRQFQMSLAAGGIRGGAEVRERSLAALAATGLPEPARVLRSYPHQLSGGMAQRVVVALATVLGPRILVADEPTSALDVSTQRHVLDNLCEDVRANHRACLLITHDIRIAAHYCDRVLVMYQGNALEIGAVTSVLDSPRHPYTRQLLAAVPGVGARRRVDRSWRPRTEVLAGPHCPYWHACKGSLDPRCRNQLPPMREIEPGHLVKSFCD